MVNLNTSCNEINHTFTDTERNKLCKDFKLCDKALDYPVEIIDKILRLNLIIKLYFEKRKDAEKELKVKQSSLSRYMRGVACTPHSLAKRIKNDPKFMIKDIEDICYCLNDL
jgi:hypothetical protein